MLTKFGLHDDFPSFYETIWICTFNVSNGWIKHVAIHPDNPPITNGANESYSLYFLYFAFYI